MTLFLDAGTVLWKAAFAQQNGNEPWSRIDSLIESGAKLCLDSRTSIRKLNYPNYKANRKTLAPATRVLLYAAIELSRESKKRYKLGEQVLYEEGLEADDLVALYYKPGDRCVSGDKDYLQLPGLTMYDSKFDVWGFERLNKQVRTNIDTHERCLVWQMMKGDVADNIPRLIPSGERRLLAELINGENPLKAALERVGYLAARDQLSLVLLPTPLHTGIDPVEYAIARYYP